MDPALVAELCSLKDDQTAINTKVSKMMGLLEKHGQLLSPGLLLVHPANRCGMLVNSFDCHEKGYRALSVGFDASKLTESVCFEVAKDPATKAMQVQSNAKLVAGSETRLAPVSQMERYLTVSSSHVSQFCKAVACGNCSTEHEVLKGLNNGALTIDSLQNKFKDKIFEQLAHWALGVCFSAFGVCWCRSLYRLQKIACKGSPACEALVPKTWFRLARSWVCFRLCLGLGGLL